MRPAVRWLLLAAVLFVAWIGYLAYLAWGLRQQAAEGGGQPVVLSRPQFLIADLVVTAEIEAPDRKPASARIKEVHWSRHPGGDKWVDQTIPIENLAGRHALQQAGDYIVPLVHEHDSFRVAPTPPSPGFPPHRSNQDPDLYPIYPSTPATQAQLHEILARQHKP